MLKALISNADLGFWNFDPKIHFCENLGQKTQTCPFCLKIGAHGISRMLILISTLVFWISNQTSIFGQMWAKKLKVVCGTNGISAMWIPTLVFWILKPKSIFGQSYGQEVELPVLSDAVTHCISRVLICFIWNL